MRRFPSHVTVNQVYSFLSSKPWQNLSICGTEKRINCFWQQEQNYALPSLSSSFEGKWMEKESVLKQKISLFIKNSFFLFTFDSFSYSFEDHLCHKHQPNLHLHTFTTLVKVSVFKNLIWKKLSKTTINFTKYLCFTLNRLQRAKESNPILLLTWRARQQWKGKNQDNMLREVLLTPH